MEKDIYKPKYCRMCPVVKRDKKKMWCGCMPKNQATLGDMVEIKRMWNKCPIDWEEE